MSPSRRATGTSLPRVRSVGVAGSLLGVALAVVGFTPGPSAAWSSDRQRLGARYLVIATAGNRRLETAFDRLEGPDRHSVAAADADLRMAAAAELRFDRGLLAIVFPPAVEAAAHRLVTANQARACLTARAAHSTSLTQLRRFERLLAAANVPVEREVRTIRADLGLPPPMTS